ncbi:MAG: MoxR family ATPase [Phycisphaeraceae bacterium]|nr:MoxR family ATPase [Phycisphaeraceae bacterium]
MAARDGREGPVVLRLGDVEAVERACSAFARSVQSLRDEIGRRIVGQGEVVDLTLTALLADGHVLLEGPPGLGKTLLVRTLAGTLGLSFARIQFTPDVMPADITGTQIVSDDPGTGRREILFRPGPIFTQVLLADEINRATPRSQSALLEAMQERSVTVAGTTHRLRRPFLVLATQNPIEQEGTYPLPEAQLDRFLLKILVPMTTRHELHAIVRRTTGDPEPEVRQVLDERSIVEAQMLVREVPIADHVRDFAIRLVMATHPGSPDMPREVEHWIRVGASPRAAQALVLGARVRALVDGRYAVAFRDLESIAAPVLRHRIVRTFEAEAEGITTDEIIRTLLARVPRAPGPAGGGAGRKQ